MCIWQLFLYIKMGKMSAKITEPLYSRITQNAGVKGNYWEGVKQLLGCLVISSLLFHPYQFHLLGSTLFVIHRLLSMLPLPIYCSQRTPWMSQYWHVTARPSHRQPAVLSVKPLWALCALFICTISCQDTCINIEPSFWGKGQEISD